MKKLALSLAALAISAGAVVATGDSAHAVNGVKGKAGTVNSVRVNSV